MLLNIPPWVSTNTSNYKSKNSRTYISNRKTNQIIILKYEASDLWYLILNSKNNFENNSKLLDYINKNNLSDEFSEFVQQLKDLGILVDKKNLILYDKKTNINNQNSTDNEILYEWTKLDLEEHKLYHMHIDLTYNCNLKCLHCYCDGRSKKEQIKFKELKKIIDEAYELGLTHITLSGGECTLADDFLKIAKYIRKKRIELTVFTNGQILFDNTKLFNEIVKIYPHTVSFSLYSLKEDIHDKITQVKGSLNKTLQVIENFKENNIPVEIKCFLTQYNADYFEEVKEYCRNNHFEFKTDSDLVLNSNNSNAHSKILTSQLINLLNFKYKNNLIKVQDINNINFFNENPCAGGHTTLYISPSFDLKTCPNSNIILGNLKNTSLKDIWLTKKNKKLQKWQKLKRKDYKDCFKNEYCKYCNFCPIKTQNQYEKQNLCNSAKLTMEIFKNNEP